VEKVPPTSPTCSKKTDSLLAL